MAVLTPRPKNPDVFPALIVILPFPRPAHGNRVQASTVAHPLLKEGALKVTERAIDVLGKP
jgi:hypothetical protein